MLISFFGTDQDKENVKDFIDPASKVARPLDLEGTDGEENQGEVTASTAAASTSMVGAYTPFSEDFTSECMRSRPGY